ncbi:carboxylic acid reductase [Mycobacterium decipiens]|uniref:Carboxylic acid reductase n=1 Tax=Mycobacterium decipiens TaxID=1430326 RepID=A0A1X2LYL0_9MYCO|nr:carboxylic acid reductase [Mycobacterium decipiens]OSC42260.1 oxidoreductase [Mycobacterium decipiens]
MAEARAAITTVVHDPSKGLAQVMAAVMEGHGDRPALGERARKSATGRLLPRFDTISYRELWARVRAIASEWYHDRRYPLSAGDRIGILGFSSTDYATLDLACMHSGIVSVPLQSSAPLSQLWPIIAETETHVLAASIERLNTAVEAVIGGTSIQRVIVFDYHPEIIGQRETFDSARRRLADLGRSVVVESLATVIEHGTDLPPAPLFTADAGEDALALLIYTSGSTGTPKGAMYTQRLVRTIWNGFTYGSDDVPPIGVHYLPQSHLAGRMSLMGLLARGGIGYFTAASDLSTLFEDIALVRPTELTMVPRVCDVLFQHYQSELARRGGEPGDIEMAVKADLRENLLGGRVAKAFVGTAPLSAEMVSFVESCLNLHLHIGYGSTEAGGVLLDTVVQRPPVIEYKLVDVPELGYFRTDRPHPRGELLLKSETIIPGYFKRPKATAEVFDEDGYYRTGDIMAEIGFDRLVYVDRVKDVLKLSQGEFVAVSRLETIFLGSPLIRQIFLYGNSERPYLLAVVVPAPAALARAGTDVKSLRKLLTESLQQIAKGAELNRYEIPRDVLIELEPFTVGNGLLADSHKLLRPRLKQRYGRALEQRYIELADAQAEQLRQLRQAGPDQPVLETVCRAAQALLGHPTTDLRAQVHFTDLGGDSLSALSFCTLMQDIFGIEVPVAVVISPANDLPKVAKYIEAQRESRATRPTFASVHGENCSEVRAADLTLDKFIDASTLAAAAMLPRPAGALRTVLLTGANGYLGRFLCLEWLQRLAPAGGKLICVVRGSDPTVAAKRLEQAFDSGDAELLERYQKLAEAALEVLAGDIGEPHLGLGGDTWNRLADTVDLIVHPAALVNHVLPYSELFGPNVVGTAELLRLALATRIKPVTYVSTAAVQTGAAAATVDENADIRATSPVRHIDQGYANGYATSKWAGEVLLREAHDLFGLPVATFRSDMILAHSRYLGQLNVPDMFTRLLHGVVATGIAPGSFYRTGTRAHYDGLPVDFTAQAIAMLGAQAIEGYQTFNVVNPHDDAISLDTFVDWLIAAGHPIQRVVDYDDWLTRFTAALRALPDKQRQHSVLPLLHAFAQPQHANPGSVLPAERFRAAVQAAKVGPEEDIPRLSAALIGKYVTDLRHLNLL